jgi:putative ABC transport system permease protein
VLGNILAYAQPESSDYADPWLVSGQWPPQENAVLPSAEVLKMWGLADQLIEPGQPARVMAAGRQADDWVLGGALGKLNVAMAYTTYDSYAKLTGQEGLANTLSVRVTPGEDVAAVIDGLAGQLEQDGYSVQLVSDVVQLNQAELAAYNILVFSLYAVVALTALVGGLGLLSTLTISVMERRREIGILRSMGARPALISRLVMTEGLLVSLLSLPLSYLLAWPLTALLGKGVVTGITGFAPDPVYRLDAAIIWAVLVCSLALLSSWMPARQAGRLSIRETLIYQG